MSYHVNAAGKDGAVSRPALSLDDAKAEAEALRTEGHSGVVIVDAGTGDIVREHAEEPVPASTVVGAVADKIDKALE